MRKWSEMVRKTDHGWRMAQQKSSWMAQILENQQRGLFSDDFIKIFEKKTAKKLR